MNEEEFGSSAEYHRAFDTEQRVGIAENHLALLRAHFNAQSHRITWADLASAVGYSAGSSVHLQYGRLAERIARQLGLHEKPRDPNGEAWWLWVLVRWAPERVPNGHTAFALRRPVVEALTHLGLVTNPTITLLPEELEVTAPIREGAKYQVLVNAYERNPEARRRCLAAHGLTCCICGFNFGAVYGPEADGYIHVHHVRPLSEIGEEYVVNPVEDLRPVCPNCHAVLHLGGRCRTVDEVRQVLEVQKRNGKE